MTGQTTPIRVSDRVTVDVPVDLVPDTAAGIDSAARSLAGPKLDVLVDTGPFADPLDRYDGLPHFRESTEQISGHRARVVRFSVDDGSTYTVAAHIPELDRLTVVVRAAREVPDEVALQIIRSIRQTNP